MEPFAIRSSSCAVVSPPPIAAIRQPSVIQMIGSQAYPQPRRSPPQARRGVWPQLRASSQSRKTASRRSPEARVR